LAAVGEAGSAIISIDPAKGTFTGLATTPTAATRVGEGSVPSIVKVELGMTLPLEQ